MKNHSTGWSIISILIAGLSSTNVLAQTTVNQIQTVKDVKIIDAFWKPKLDLYATTTANDVLDKFEANNLTTAEERNKNNVFKNFDDVAQGKKGINHHAGLPWFDGLVYESIRGIGDLLKQHPNKQVEARLDALIDRIALAQQADPNGYINTYTDLKEPTHRWGDNGGFLRWQHDVYNAGMLVDAGVHYYKATGKTKLLDVATRYANYMSALMGPAPKRNIVPAHSGPEEALIKLYWLYKQNPELKSKIKVPVNAQAYYDLATFWIENRGKNAGYPLWLSWGNDKSEKWIKDQQYKSQEFGNANRPTWGDYAQDSIPVFQQKTIEGHAVRATLLATGITTAALENHSPDYIRTAHALWNNMVGKRMFVTGGVGAIHNDEKFGPDNFLPTDAYLETCAAVGAGFFSQRMNELTGDARYIDEFERTLYNNVLTGISLSGTKYTYQNPLNSHEHSRWDWHSCPCCPPMFLKIVSAMPDYIYATAPERLYVNLFVGSSASAEVTKGIKTTIEQTTNYPWNGKIELKLNPEKQSPFALYLRIPGWAQGKENPYGLYHSQPGSGVKLAVNGKVQDIQLKDGYAIINRTWKKGDVVSLELPMQPRLITASDNVKDLTGKVALASGPIIYSLENVDNANLDQLKILKSTSLKLDFEPKTLDGINVIRGVATDSSSQQLTFTAIPYYAVGNREVKGYKVWVDALEALKK
ncbi:glycoside hydrolase family 127 protein [Emticicia sp. BO119]|uniref:glycoside hydrolase family 127 protein n=1 Tax=Emticicia sp. BO119 TaxID=2757768 RepID=UPI0015F064DE|nr:beta-L-arabinofuranosidase domain-containing protein [Emticicia sp. BO119]MBA4851275.1 glycoside hydrolase family 127 protein [Emticicia sp. BO119]